MTIGSLALLAVGISLGQGQHGLNETLRTALMVIMMVAGGVGLFLAVTWPPKVADRIRAGYSLENLPGCLRDRADAIRQLARPAVCLSAEPLIEGEPEDTADSKFGGLPYLAGPEDWPATSKEEPMVFVGQLNFARIAAQLSAARESRPAELPRAGLLQLFTTWRDWDSESATPQADIWRTRWIAQPERPFVPEALPEKLEILPASLLHARVGRTLPEPGDLARPTGVIGQDRARLEAYDDLLSVMSVGAGEGQILGHGCWDADPRQSLPQPASWRLLWQIHGDSILEVGDFGPLYILIRDADLRAGRFDDLIVRTEY